MASLKKYFPYIYLTRSGQDYLAVVAVPVAADESLSASLNGNVISCAVAVNSAPPSSNGNAGELVVQRREITIPSTGISPGDCLTIIVRVNNFPVDLSACCNICFDDVDPEAGYQAGDVVPLLLLTVNNQQSLALTPGVIIHPATDRQLSAQTFSVGNESTTALSEITTVAAQGQSVNQEALTMNQVSYNLPGNGSTIVESTADNKEKRRVKIRQHNVLPDPLVHNPVGSSVTAEPVVAD